MMKIELEEEPIRNLCSISEMSVGRWYGSILCLDTLYYRANPSDIIVLVENQLFIRHINSLSDERCYYEWFGTITINVE